MHPPRRVVIVGYEAAELLDIACVSTTLDTANRIGADPAYEVVLATPGGRAITCDSGLTLVAQEALERVRGQLDTLLVSGGYGHEAAAADPWLVDQVRRLARTSRRVASVCTGASVLAAAGLLDGRRATTHWAWAADFARRFPGVAVDADVLYLEDGNLLTSAGTAAGIDCCLYLLRQQHGAELANRVARRLVVPPHRQGGQAQFIEQPLPATSRDDRLADLLDWVRAHLDLPHSLDSLAGRALMSRRSFTRHFRQLTGSTVGDWLLAERLALTQRLLESTEQSVEAIAGLAGFGSPVSLRHHFGRAFGVSPSAWRQTFRGH